MAGGYRDVHVRRMDDAQGHGEQRAPAFSQRASANERSSTVTGAGTRVPVAILVEQACEGASDTLSLRCTRCSERRCFTESDRK